jgi:hypothetical protein
VGWKLGFITVSVLKTKCSQGTALLKAKYYEVLKATDVSITWWQISKPAINGKMKSKLKIIEQNKANHLSSDRLVRRHTFTIASKQTKKFPFDF